jgi:RNA methyltransferase, TrmH family
MLCAFSIPMITSLQHAKVKYVRSLSDRKQRIAAGRLAIEGARLIDDALAANCQPEWVICAPRLPPRAQETLQRLKARHVEVIDVSDAVLKACSETEMPQGLIAVIAQPQLAWPRAPHLIVIADRLRDPGNLGTLLRSSAAAGVSGVLLAPETVEAFNPKVVRGAMGAHFRLPILEADWAAIADRVRGLNVYVAEADGARSYTTIDWTCPAALIVGGEAEGTSAAAARLGVTTVRISIPLAREVESLNAAVAASVILFEAKRQRERE